MADILQTKLPKIYFWTEIFKFPNEISYENLQNKIPLESYHLYIW